MFSLYHLYAHPAGHDIPLYGEIQSHHKTPVYFTSAHSYSFKFTILIISLPGKLIIYLWINVGGEDAVHMKFQGMLFTVDCSVCNTCIRCVKLEPN